MLLNLKRKNKKTSANQDFVMGLIVVIIGGAFFLVSSNIIIPEMMHHDSAAEVKTEGVALIKTANAAEIYPEFFCACCGRPLDPNNICCGSMRNMINYIDEKVKAGLTEDELMMSMVKEFGFETLVSDETKKEIKVKLASLAPADSPEIVFSEESYDFGEVSQAKGVTTTTFDFKNEGESDLIVNKIGTSCGCTSAAVVYRGKEGPSFTMPGHGKENPEDWSVSIAPGDSALLKVYFDPNAHGKQEEAVLPITRTINVFSNDPVEFEKQVKIELNQIP